MPSLSSQTPAMRALRRLCEPHAHTHTRAQIAAMLGFSVSKVTTAMLGLPSPRGGVAMTPEQRHALIAQMWPLRAEMGIATLAAKFSLGHHTVERWMEQMNRASQGDPTANDWAHQLWAQWQHAVPEGWPAEHRAPHLGVPQRYSGW